MRSGVLAILAAADAAEADRALQESYGRTPPDPALVESARRLAAETTPGW